MPIFTTKLNLAKPVVGADDDAWGGMLNTNMDVIDGLAPLNNPVFTGNPQAPTANLGDADTTIATTAFVQAALGSVPGGAVIAPTPPALSPGALWWDSTGGQLYVRYDDGNTVQYVPASNTPIPANVAFKTDVAAAQTNVGRNLIHNSAFTVAQRGAGGFNGVTTGWTMSFDRWQLIAAAAGDTGFNHTLAPMTDAYRAQIGDESGVNALVVNFTGGAGAANACISSQFIEGVRRLAGKTVTVSFYALAAGTSPKLGVSLDQFFGGGGSPSAAVTGIGQSVTVSSATWARYSLTFTVPSIAGKTLGTNGFDQTSLMFWHSAGANNATRSGSVGVQTGTHLIWGVQLEIAQPGQTTPTPLEKRDPVVELQQCQRFYSWGTAFLACYGVAASAIGSTVYLPVIMRATPTAVTFTPTGNTNVGTVTISAQSAGSAIYFTTITGTGVGQIQGTYTASADL